jgi:glycosyltransferase involved in cell wall biosynthesis
MIGLSIIIASSGRPTLLHTLASVQSQMRPGDELIVDVNSDAPYGHAARNRIMFAARRNQGLCFIDDDDIYVPGALMVMREAFRNEPKKIHMFRMLYGDRILWETPELKCGNVSTQMFVVPTSAAWRPGVKWGDRYEGDFDFIREASWEREIVWHERVIAHYGAGYRVDASANDGTARPMPAVPF